MQKELKLSIKHATGANEVLLGETIQSLWSGYGEIVRVELLGNAHSTRAVLKYIKPPLAASHPRGWNTDESHARKIRSYDVENTWYTDYARRTHSLCKVPTLLASGKLSDAQWILLEDLDTKYPRRCVQLSVAQATVCLRWLANLHALFLNDSGLGLWPIGCYWHLQTRQSEFDAMKQGQLKEMAIRLDQKLSDAKFQTLVHGDAKLANFCFTESIDEVAAVDFQYVGRGPGIRDVVYFLGSCINESEIRDAENELLDVYFNELKQALSDSIAGEYAQEVEREWRALYAIAWTDFYRFLEGWMPEHKKINAYTKRLAKQAFAQLR